MIEILYNIDISSMDPLHGPDAVNSAISRALRF